MKISIDENFLDESNQGSEEERFERIIKILEM